jgi:hypothetical protein
VVLGLRGGDPGAFADFGGASFARISNNKLLVVRAALQTGLEVLMCDGDIVFVRNPLERVVLEARGADWAVQINNEMLNPPEPNTGFMLVRPTPQTFAFLDDILDYARERRLAKDEQYFTWQQLGRAVRAGKPVALSFPQHRGPKSDSPLILQYLNSTQDYLDLPDGPPTTRDPPDQLWMRFFARSHLTIGPHATGDQMLIAHPNFLKGFDAKVENLRRRRLWYIVDDGDPADYPNCADPPPLHRTKEGVDPLAFDGNWV